MAKYGSGLSIKDTCELETQEASEILKRYKVPREERKVVTGMIEQAYYLLRQESEVAKILEEKLEEMGVNTGTLVIEYFMKKRFNYDGDRKAAFKI